MVSMIRHTAAVILVAVLLVACKGNPNSSLAKQCSDGLDAAYKELNVAEARGFNGTLDWTKATSLLTAAKVQFEFEKYPNCIDKVKRAREYIRRSKRI